MKNFFDCHKRRIMSALTVLSLLASSIAAFLSGGFYENSKLENVSYSLCELASKSETNNSFVTLTSKEAGFKSFNAVFNYSINYCNAFYNSSPFQYFPTYNSLKDKNFSFDELSLVTPNTTILLCGAFSSHKSSDGKKNIFDACYLSVYNEKTDTVIDSDFTNFLMISDKQAKYLRDNVWHIEFVDDNNFDFAIGKHITANFGGTTTKWKIGNVFFTDGDFAKVANSAFGDFVIAYYYGLPNKESINLEIACSFQSSRFLCYNKLVNTYSQFNLDEYEFCVNSLSFLSQDAINQLNARLNSHFKTDVIFYFVIALSICLFIFYMLLMFINRRRIFYNSVASLCCFVFVWLVFKIVSLAAHSSIMFSYFSLIVYAIYVASFLIFLLICWRQKTNGNNK